MGIDDRGKDSARLRDRLASLREALRGRYDDADDQVRELYSELLEEFSLDPKALDEIRALGVVLDQAVKRGDMPRALVRRGSSRAKSRE